MKTAVIIVRVLIGLIYTAFSLLFFLKLSPQSQLSGSALTFITGIAASGYIFPTIKAIELVCGIAFLSGRFVALAAVVVFPISLNIALFHTILEPGGMLMGVFVLLGNLFLAYAYREKYAPLLSAK